MSEPSQRNWQSVRTILDGLILAGVIWLATSIQDQSRAIVRMQVQIETVQATLIDVSSLSTRVTKLETKQSELTRRQDADDLLHDRMRDKR